MIVYSVEVHLDSGTQYFGPWADECMAEAWAEEHNTDCKRVVVRWQMLNATERETFAPWRAEKRSNA